MSTSKTTKSHDEIRNWAEARHAVPCEVEGTERDSETGILRFEFPEARNRNDDRLREISWDEFFSKFDENDLELLYQEKTSDGQTSNFNKLIHPETEKHSRSATSKGSHNKGRAAA
ncbi:MAG TPA: hypothetical protein VF730_16645 [Terracidiphilus sp.]